jgi:hypothetical protein
MADLGPCSACGAPGSGIRLNNRPYCDRCADGRLAAVTGWPTLPTPPPAEVIIGPDKKRHFVRYRLLRMPGGVVGLAEELGGPVHAGYRLELLCDHFADPTPRVIVDGQSMSWVELGELLKSYVGWSFELRLGGDLPSRGGGDTPARITVRKPTAAELHAAARALRSSDGAYILDSTHYPTPAEWAKRD